MGLSTRHFPLRSGFLRSQILTLVGSDGIFGLQARTTSISKVWPLVYGGNPPRSHTRPSKIVFLWVFHRPFHQIEFSEALIFMVFMLFMCQNAKKRPFWVLGKPIKLSFWGCGIPLRWVPTTYQVSNLANTIPPSQETQYKPLNPLVSLSRASENSIFEQKVYEKPHKTQFLRVW